MADTIHCNYLGNTRMEISKEGVKDILHTAHDNAGLYVTPGDMLAGALGACTLTMMEAAARRAGKNLDGAKITVIPVFDPAGGGLREVTLRITLPPGTDETMRSRYLAMAQACPVHKSLNPAIKFTVLTD